MVVYRTGEGGREGERERKREEKTRKKTQKCFGGKKKNSLV
jgi:hypothetical protein